MSYCICCFLAQLKSLIHLTMSLSNITTQDLGNIAVYNIVTRRRTESPYIRQVNFYSFYIITLGYSFNIWSY